MFPTPWHTENDNTVCGAAELMEEAPKKLPQVPAATGPALRPEAGGGEPYFSRPVTS